MKKLTILFIVQVVCITCFTQFAHAIDFKDYFENKTMRVDYFHSGDADEEHFSVDRILNDGQWAGSKTKVLDDLKLGLYFFEILDKSSGQLIYSRGFASIFGEWQTIPEAQEKWGTFHESLRFPWPINSVQVVMKKRDAQNKFQIIWETEIDPLSRSVNPAFSKSTFEGCGC